MATTIFYENSYGFISQWTGEVLRATETTVDIRFSKNKALRFDLKTNSGFMVITKNKIKSLGVSVNERLTSVSHNDNTREYILSQTEGNVDLYWNGSSFQK